MFNIKKVSIPNWIVVALSVLLFIILLIIAVKTNIYPEFKAIPNPFIGALLGVIITVIVTTLLLNGQTQEEVKKERNVKIFNLMRKAFSCYINRVWEIMEDNDVDYDEFRELYSNYKKNVAIYLDKKADKEFVGCLIEISKKIEFLNEKEDADSKTRDEIKEKLYVLINILVKKLGLGGEVNAKKHNELDNEFEKTLFPVFFKKAIKTEIYNVLKEYKCFLPGKYESVYNKDNPNEFLCFYFDIKNPINFYPKLIIGPFKGEAGSNEALSKAGEICIFLYIDKDIENWTGSHKGITTLKDYKDGTNFFRRIIGLTEEGEKYYEIYKPIKNITDKSEDNKNIDTNETYLLNFEKTNELQNIYSPENKYKQVAKVLANRVSQYIRNVRISEKIREVNDQEARVIKGSEFSIIEFMEHSGFIEKNR